MAAGSLPELSRQNNRVWSLLISLILFLKELSRDILVTCVFREDPDIEAMITPSDTVAYS